MAIKDPSLEKRVNCSYQPMNSDGSFFPSCPETNQFPSCGQIKYVIHVVYVATRSLFPQFVIYIYYCVSIWSTCVAWFALVFACIYIYIFDCRFIWIISVLWTVFCPCVCTLMNCCPHYFAEVWTTDIICTCIKLGGLHTYIYVYIGSLDFICW